MNLQRNHQELKPIGPIKPNHPKPPKPEEPMPPPMKEPGPATPKEPKHKTPPGKGNDKI